MIPQEVHVVTYDSEIVGIYARGEDAEQIMALEISSRPGVPADLTDIERHYIKDQVDAEDEIADLKERL